MSKKQRMGVKIQPTPNNTRAVKEKETPWIVRTIFSIIQTLLKWSGLAPFTFSAETKSVKYKLLSVKTFLCFLRLLIFTFPFAILPFIFLLCGLVEEDAFAAILTASENSKSSSYFSSTAGKIVSRIEIYVNVLAYMLPFALPHFLAKPLETIYRIRTAEHNLDLEKSRISIEGTLFPMIGFILFFIGKLLSTISEFEWCFNQIEGFSKYHFFIYYRLCTSFCINFPLHFLLATYEYFFYRNLPTYCSLVKRVLKTEDPRLLLTRTKELTIFMESTQNGYGFFLLIDLTLMLLFWLIHTFKAYFTFQVSHISNIMLWMLSTYSKTLTAVGSLRGLLLSADHLGGALQGVLDLRLLLQVESGDNP